MIFRYFCNATLTVSLLDSSSSESFHTTSRCCSLGVWNCSPRQINSLRTYRWAYPMSDGKCYRNLQWERTGQPELPVQRMRKEHWSDVNFWHLSYFLFSNITFPSPCLSLSVSCCLYLLIVVVVYLLLFSSLSCFMSSPIFWQLKVIPSLPGGKEWADDFELFENKAIGHVIPSSILLSFLSFFSFLSI